VSKVPSADVGRKAHNEEHITSTNGNFNSGTFFAWLVCWLDEMLHGGKERKRGGVIT